LNTLLNNIPALLPNYRFQVISQKANELCNDVKTLGNQLLSVLERRDAEELSLLRSGQEIKLLTMIRDIKVKQIDEAKENVNSLNAARIVTEEKYNYFAGKEYLNFSETLYFGLSQSANAIQGLLNLNYALASLKHLFPVNKLGSGFTMGIEHGGPNLGNAAIAALEGGQSFASFLRTGGEMAQVKAGYDRREEDWDFQAKTAELELKQMDKQILAAEIRLAITEKELNNHDQQIKNTREIDEYMRSKFTNFELYDWMVKQISSVYFQAYQLAHDFAGKAEQCYRFELGNEDSFISYGYWDSMKQGLQSADHLSHDIKRMETSYLDKNKREYELTKHVSLAMLNPRALIDLKTTGSCQITLPEELFDLDYPGHYFRRIKSISLTIPCVAGPYTTVNATLRLHKNEIRFNTKLNTEGNYERNNEDGIPIDDDRFVEGRSPSRKIATSSAQGDSGMFELNFRDERYLPFEGAGVISTWKLELNGKYVTDEGVKDFSQFDDDSISDAIIHISYLAREDAGKFKQESIIHLENFLKKVAENAPEPFMQMLSLKHQFPNAFHQLLEMKSNPQKTEIEIDRHHFPILFANKNLKVLKAELFLQPKKGKTGIIEPDSVKMEKTTETGRLEVSSSGAWVKLPHSEIMKINLTLSSEEFSPFGKWSLEVNDAESSENKRLKEDEIEDLLILMKYSLK